MHAWAVRSGLIGLLTRPAHLLGGRAAFLVDPLRMASNSSAGEGSAGAAGFFRCSGRAGASAFGPARARPGEAPRRPVAARPRSPAAALKARAPRRASPRPSRLPRSRSRRRPRPEPRRASPKLLAAGGGRRGLRCTPPTGEQGPDCGPGGRGERQFRVCSHSRHSFTTQRGRATPRAAAILDELCFAGPADSRAVREGGAV